MRFFIFLLLTSTVFSYSQQFETIAALAKNEQALNLLEAGKFREALPAAKEAYRLICKAEGEKSANSLTIMGNMLLIYERLGQYKKLQPLYERCLRLKIKVNGREDYDTLITMKNFGSFLRKVGKLKKSCKLLEETLQLQSKLFGKGNDHTLVTMQSLATTYTQMGRFPQAQALYKQCIQLLEKQKKNSAAIVNNDFAVLYEKMGLYSTAERLLRNCIAARQKLLGSSHPETIISLHNLGSLYIEMGEYDKAENLYVSLSGYLQKSFGKTHALTLSMRSNLAIVYRENLQLNESLQINREILDIRRKTLGNAHPDTIVSMNNLAANLSVSGKYNEAQILYREALQYTEKTFGKKHLEYLTTQANLAANYVEQNRYSVAYDIIEDVLKNAQELVGNDHPFVTRVMANLIVLHTYYQSQKLNEKKINYIKNRLLVEFGVNNDLTINTYINMACWLISQDKKQQSYDLLNSMWNKLQKFEKLGHRRFILLLTNFSFVCFYLEKYDEAQLHLEQLNDVIKKVLGEDHYFAITTKLLLGQVYVAKKKNTQALEVFASAIDQLYAFMKNLLLTTNRETRLSLFSRYRALQEDVLQFYVQVAAKEKMFDYSLRFKNLLFEISSQGRVSQHKNNSEQVTTLREKRQLLSAMYFEKNPQKTQEIKKICREIEELESQMASNNVITNSMTREKIQQKLHVKEAIVDFLVVKDTLVATIVKKNELHLLKIGNWSHIAHLIATFREQLTKKAKVSHQISQLLYLPLQPYLEDVVRLYVIPDSDLFLLPFSCLQINGEYLAQKHHVVTLNSAVDLWSDHSKLMKGKNIAIFADADFDAEISSENIAVQNLFFPALKGTKNEAEYLHDVFKKNGYEIAKYVRAKATKQQFQNTTCQILHIATHGFSLSKNNAKEKDTRGISVKNNIVKPVAQEIITTPNAYAQKVANNLGTFDPLLSCGLAFAGANHNAQQIITAYEIQQLDLNDARLIVLSACETDVGSIREGSGVLGIRRAFRDAGAKTVVSTLWQIDDKATAIFIKTFYDYLFEGASVRSALRLTQKKFIGDSEYHHPFYWGAFVVDGVDVRIAVPRTKNSWLPLLVFAFLFLVVLIAVLGIKKQKKAQQMRLQERTRRRELSTK